MRAIDAGGPLPAVPALDSPETEKDTGVFLDLRRRLGPGPLLHRQDEEDAWSSLRRRLGPFWAWRWPSPSFSCSSPSWSGLGASSEKQVVYECGERPTGSPWIKFNIRFYVVALIFVIFDVEVVFLYPWGRSSSRQLRALRLRGDDGLPAHPLRGPGLRLEEGDLEWVRPVPKLLWNPAKPAPEDFRPALRPSPAAAEHRPGSPPSIGSFPHMSLIEDAGTTASS